MGKYLLNTIQTFIQHLSRVRNTLSVLRRTTYTYIYIYSIQYYVYFWTCKVGFTKLKNHLSRTLRKLLKHIFLALQVRPISITFFCWCIMAAETAQARLIDAIWGGFPNDSNHPVGCATVHFNNLKTFLNTKRENRNFRTRVDSLDSTRICQREGGGKYGFIAW